MTITAVGATAFAIPYKRPLELATGPVAEHRAVLIAIADDQGYTGCGELAPGPGTTREEVADLATRALRDVPVLCGRSVDGMEDVRRLRTQLDAALRPACEAALLDLAAQRARRPLHRLLGSDGENPATVAVNAMIDRAPPDAVLAAVRDAIAAGYSTLKLKVDRRGVDGCVELLSRLRRDYGSRITIRLDCNGSWPLATAAAAMQALARFDLEYVEQPTPTLAELAQLRGLRIVAIAADESVADLEAIRTAVDTAAADVLVVKPARLGLIDAIDAAALAAEAGIQVVVTSNLDTSIGCAAGLHLAHAIAGYHGAYAHGLGTVASLGGDLCRAEHSLIPRRGRLRVPSGAGCGVAVDDAQIERWRSE